MPDVAVTLEVGAAVVLLAGAALWRPVARRRAVSKLQALMESPDPPVRRAAIESIGAHGLGRYVGLLLQRAARERDPEVIAALAGVVSRNQWEPVDVPALVALRDWSRHHFEGRAPVPPRDTGAPRVAAADLGRVEDDLLTPVAWHAPAVKWHAPTDEDEPCDRPAGAARRPSHMATAGASRGDGAP
jgi:hypothetical protein